MFKRSVDLARCPKQAKMSQDGLRKCSKRANMAIASDFENMHLICFYCVFGTPDLPKDPKTAQKPPKMAPGSVQEPFKNQIRFWIDFLAKTDPEMAPKVDQTIAKTCPKKIPTKRKIRSILGRKMDPKMDKNL